MGLPVEIALIVFGGVCAYALLLRRLAFLAQPARLRMAEHGERLLASDLPSGRAEQIRFCLDNAFDGWVVFVAALVFPLIAVFGPLYLLSKGRMAKAAVGSDERYFAELFAISAFAANPLFGTIAVAEFAILGFLLLLISGPQLVADVLTLLVDIERRAQGRHGQVSGTATAH
jgi:hypothetical protein